MNQCVWGPQQALLALTHLSETGYMCKFLHSLKHDGRESQRGMFSAAKHICHERYASMHMCDVSCSLAVHSSRCTWNSYRRLCLPAEPLPLCTQASSGMTPVRVLAGMGCNLSSAKGRDAKDMQALLSGNGSQLPCAHLATSLQSDASCRLTGLWLAPKLLVLLQSKVHVLRAGTLPGWEGAALLEG